MQHCSSRFSPFLFAGKAWVRAPHVRVQERDTERARERKGEGILGGVILPTPRRGERDGGEGQVGRETRENAGLLGEIGSIQRPLSKSFCSRCSCLNSARGVLHKVTFLFSGFLSVNVFRHSNSFDVYLWVSFDVCLCPLQLD